MPQYTKFEDVRQRLKGKVRFTDDETVLDLMQVSLANRLIDEAESQVETDLTPRYQVPFVHADTQKFKDLPDRPTRNIIRTLCELQAVMRILETDFGSGTSVEASKYIANIEKRYNSILFDDNKGILAKVSGDGRQWKLPPLNALKLNYFNTEGDDGYAGMVLVTSQGVGDYPSHQINDPSTNLWSGLIDDGNDPTLKGNS